jgi:hypothetical protein
VSSDDVIATLQMSSDDLFHGRNARQTMRYEVETSKIHPLVTEFVKLPGPDHVVSVHDVQVL